MVRTNSDGWKDIVLSDSDNADIPDLQFKVMEDQDIQMHRTTADFIKISSLQVYLSGDYPRSE